MPRRKPSKHVFIFYVLIFYYFFPLSAPPPTTPCSSASLTSPSSASCPTQSPTAHGTTGAGRFCACASRTGRGRSTCAESTSPWTRGTSTAGTTGEAILNCFFFFGNESVLFKYWFQFLFLSFAKSMDILYQLSTMDKNKYLTFTFLSLFFSLKNLFAAINRVFFLIL